MSNNILELVMIVKNSGNILRECLQNNKHIIDYWTICDTGSTDNTKEIVVNELKDIPGKLHSIKFNNFSDARNKSLDLSSKTCKYTIVLDDSYVIKGGNDLKNLLSKSNEKCFLITIGHLYNDKLIDSYKSIRIFKSDLHYRYKYRVHEILDIKKDKFDIIDEVSDIFIDDIETTEHKNRTVRRFKNDIELLLQDLKDYPKDPRIFYYLGKTYYQLEDYINSLSFFNSLHKLKNINQEYKFSAEYEMSCINFTTKSYDIEEFKKQLLIIQKKYPDRIEPAYKLAVILKDEGNLQQAEIILDQLSKQSKPSNDFTIMEPEIFDFFIPYLSIEVKLQLGKVYSIVNKLKSMLQTFPYNQPLLNVKYAITDSMNISSLKLSNNKTIVLHTGGQQMIFKNWNPRGDKRISGSEYMAINLGKEFLKKGYKVIIVGSFEDKNIDNQGIVDDIQYIDYKYFSNFALTYIIDYLIVSRFTSNLLYYDNIKNVYLWVHDVLPVMDSSKCFQTHRTKFKGIISVSNWQKQNIIEKLNLPSDKIFVSRNAIYPQRFINHNIQKQPYRFIYTSDPSRGLSKLIDILPFIKEKFPETTLYIFALIENIDESTLQKIEIMKSYVFLNSRLSQQEIANEFLKSDIWFYPTDFKETYCISAVEAMCAKCLVCTVDLGALTEIIMGKGILCKYPINQEKMLEKIFFVLNRPNLKQNFIEKAYEWAINQRYDNLADDWERDFFN
jgi:glycosyltransferase involved in cell wall biosynthesis